MSALSYVRGASAPPLIEKCIGESLQDAAWRWPDTPALISVHQNVRMTWRELKSAVDEVALGLLALGVGPGDRVAIWAPNCAEWVLTQFATASIGVVLVNMNPAYRQSEAAFTLRKTGAKALIVASQVKSSNYVELVEGLAPELFAEPSSATGELPDLAFVVKIGGEPRSRWIDFAELAERGRTVDAHRLREIASGLSPHDPVNIQFTSGTTGTPKGATLSHHNILNNGYFVGAAIGLSPGERVCIPVPLYHCFGMVMGNLACLTHGATMVYPSATYDPLAVLSAIESERCAAIYGVPTMFIAELQHPRFAEFDLSSLRTGIMAGSPCPVEVMRQVVERMHVRDVTISYGMTETSPVSFQSAPDDPLARRVETVGRVMPHLECKIVDADGATTLLGQAGELCTRGYSVMLGYWNEPEATRAVLDADGWMRSGDLAVLDEDGYCRIVGRIKDMIIRGGENVYPREIEEFLYGHPDIEDVSVVGVPDPSMGEEVCAWIVPRAGVVLTEADVRGYCVGRIAHYKTPRHIRFVMGFPLTATGKVRKFEIRQAMQAEFEAAR